MARKINRKTKSMEIESADWVSMRRSIMMDIVMENPSKQWTQRELFEKMRAHPIVSKRMPNYSIMTTSRDYAAIKEETALRRKELAEQYLTLQLDQLDHGLADILSDLKTLGSLDAMLEELEQAISDDPDSAVDTLTQINKYVKSKEALYNTALRLMKRQGVLLPLEVPKEVHVQQNNFNIDLYADVRKQFEERKQARLNDGSIDGEYTEVE